MRLESILKKANKVDLTNSKLVRIFQMKRLKGPGFLAITITREPGQRPRKHLVKIYPRNPDYKGTITNCPNVMIRCDCLTGESKILTKDGWKTILELLFQKDIKYITKSGKVVNGDSPWFVGKKPTFKITLKNGFELCGTKEHKVLCFKGVKKIYDHRENGKSYYREKILYEWKTIGSLTSEDKVVCYQRNEIEDTVKDDNYWRSYLAGVYLGDGSSHSTFLNLNPIKEKYIFLKLRKHLGLEYKQISGKWRYAIDKKHIWYLKSLEICKPEKRFTIPDSCNKFALLSGLIDSDGYAKDGIVSIWGDKRLLNPLKDWLVSLGVPCKYKVVRKAGTEVCEGYAATKDHYILVITSTGVNLLRKNLCSYKVEKLPAGKKVKRLNWSYVESKSYNGLCDTFDIEIPDKHNFVANGIVVHNCARNMYKWEVANAVHKCSPIYYSNGAMPYDTNPSLRVGACKHSLRVGRAILNHKW